MPEEAGMVWHLAEWAGAVLAAGLVVAAAAAVAAWLVYRRARRRVYALTGVAARSVLQAIAGAGRERFAPPGHRLGQRTGPSAGV
jgi:hypothetical protein